MTTQGTFVPEGRHDILTEALGTDEHPGRVRTAGKGVGLKKYFGSAKRKNMAFDFVEMQKRFQNELEERIEERIEERLEERLEERMRSFCTEFMSQLSSQQQISQSQQQDLNRLAPSPSSAKKASTRSSCSPPKNVDVFGELARLAFSDSGIPKNGMTVPLDHLTQSCLVDRDDMTIIAGGERWLTDFHISFWFQ